MSLFKIKTGADPLNNNDPEEMLRWDQNRMLEIHEAVKDIRTPDTVCGHVLYYVDANGRYDTKERLQAFLDFAEEKGFLDRIVLVEEPFDESNKTDVRDLPVCIAADESAHSLEDVQERFALGYRALTLKPIAKTLSMTIRMAEFAREQGMICLCADLTVNPVMLSWNHCVASRLKPIPQMKLAALESNGEQNYLNWQTIWGYHPCSSNPLVTYEQGVFRLKEGFHAHSGGVFQQSEHFLRLFDA